MVVQVMEQARMRNLVEVEISVLKCTFFILICSALKYLLIQSISNIRTLTLTLLMRNARQEFGRCWVWLF